jgi:hypothetical protein
LETCKLRTLCFYSLCILVLGIVLLTDCYDIFDPLLTIYTLMGTMSLACAGLFGYGWQQKGKASGIYKALTFLMAGISYSMCWQFYARYMFVFYGADQYQDIINSLGWEYRNIPQIISTIYILSFAVAQIIGKDTTIPVLLPQLDTFFEVFKNLKSRDWVWAIRTGSTTIAEGIEEFKTNELAISSIEILKKDINEAQIFVRFAVVPENKVDSYE